MARESSLWAWLRRGTKAMTGLDLRRIENLCESGTPDTEGCLDRDGHNSFWMELKSVARPKRPTTPIRTCLSREQSIWLSKRWGVGGSAWLLVQVGERANRRVYLIPGYLAPDVEDGLTEAELEARSSVYPGATAEQVVLRASALRRSTRA